MINFIVRTTILILTAIAWGCDSSSTQQMNDEYIGEDGEFFHAKINGIDWYPVISIFPGNIQLYASYGGTFSLRIHRDYSPYSKLFIEINTFDGIGTYALADTSSKSYAAYYFIDAPAKNYYTDDQHTGTLEITQIDTLKRLFTGTVSFDAASGNEVIHLREGKFIAKN